MLSRLIRRVMHRARILKLKCFTWIFNNGSRIQANKIVATSFYGKGYCCNPKYITAELHKRCPSLEIVWLVEKGYEIDFPSYIKLVRYGSLQAQRELATAAVWLNNTRGARYIKKNPRQFYIQTTHSSLSAKRCEADVEDHLDEGYVRSAKQDGFETDLMFANNAFRKQLYQTSYWYDGPVIRCGAPRNKPLLFTEIVPEDSIRQQYGLGDKKICLYAPTFRRDANTDVYRLNIPQCLKSLKKRFGGEFVFCIRLHPNITYLSKDLCDDEMIDLTDYPDCQELLAITDVLISDYSSVLEDFTLTGRPAFVYAPDYDDYLDDRGFYYSLDYRPFPVAKSQDQLLLEIESFSDRDLRESLKTFFDRFDFRDDGKGAEHIAEIVLDKMEERGYLQ